MSLRFIPDVLDAAGLDAIRKEIDRGRLVDGRETAVGHTAEIKHNLQLRQPRDKQARASRMLLQALGTHPDFQNLTLGKAIRRPEFAVYREGMSYGLHLDAPMMLNGDTMLRADLSVTVFLNATDEYDGGELVIETPVGEQPVKLPAGHAVVYPSGSVHRVAEVTRGERVVAVTWVQSYVRDGELREILVDLDVVARSLHEQDPEGEAFRLLQHCRENLIRKFGEP